jgi:cytochrome c553
MSSGSDIVRSSIFRFTAVVVAVVVIGVVVAVLSSRSSSDANDGLGPITLTSQEKHGRGLFLQTCGSCHTLDDAGSAGVQGPSLEMLRPPAPATRAAIRNGPGPMPANLLQGKDADAVARYVAAVTAH